MCRLEINTKCRQYKKEDKMIKKSIYSSLTRLSEKIVAVGSDINTIYNNDSIVYDRINDNIFIYKCHGVNNIQLRIVYGYAKVGSESVIYLIDYAIKKKNDKQYIANMNDKFRTSSLSDMAFCELRC